MKCQQAPGGDQVSRLEEVFALLDEPPKRKHCAGIAGIIVEASETLKEHAPPSVMDACVIAGGQRAEHYEMAAYGTVMAWAEALELPEIAQLLNETLEEEKAADEKLSSLAEAGINEAATAGEEEPVPRCAAPRGRGGHRRRTGLDGAAICRRLRPATSSCHSRLLHDRRRLRDERCDRLVWPGRCRGVLWPAGVLTAPKISVPNADC
jgi:ferritin-like metal-binding protein YciE